jgi:hypothetical protein
MKASTLSRVADKVQKLTQNAMDINISSVPMFIMIYFAMQFYFNATEIFLLKPKGRRKKGEGAMGPLLL